MTLRTGISGDKRTLAIDDLREHANIGVICRNYWEGIKALAEFGPWDVLDRDLQSWERDDDGNVVEKTGEDILAFLDENREFLPRKIVLVTANVAAYDRMKSRIENLYRKK